MNTSAYKTQEKKSAATANSLSEQGSNNKATAQLIDNSTRTLQMKAHQEMVNKSPQMKQAAQLQAMADRHTLQQAPVFQLAGGDHAYDAGEGAYWHIHHGEHVKFGGQGETRINFGGRTRNKILRQLRGKRNLTPQSQEGAQTYHQCVNWILRNL
jgi:hypothetical protein